MVEAGQKTKILAESEATIARRLETTLRIAREDEAKFMRIIKARRLKRRAQRPIHKA